MQTTATIVGTPGYMPPEQARGDSPAVGPPADVYALGAVLYHIVTGQVSIAPVPGRHARETCDSGSHAAEACGSGTCAAEVGPDLESLFLEMRSGRFVAPRQRLGVVPAPLEAICLKAMHVDPEQRYATADVLADEVERFIADQPITAYREPRTESLLRWVRHHRGVSISVALSLLMLLVAGMTATGLIERSRRREVRAHRELIDTTRFTMRWLADMRRTTHRWTADLESLASGDMSTNERGRVMDDAITAYQQLAAASDQASLDASSLSPGFRACWLVERADCLLLLSDLLARRQRWSASEVRLRQAEELLGQIDGNPHVDVRPLLRRCEQLRAKLRANMEESR